VEAGAETEKRDRSCPVCGVGVESRWLFCPHCEEPLRPSATTPGGADVDDPRDAFGTPSIWNLLAVLGMIALGIPLVPGFAALSDGNAIPLCIALALVFVLALAGTGIVLAQGRDRRGELGASIFESTLILAGVLVVGVCAVVLAGLIFLLAVRLAV
jgi:hypothetical protein